ncbi:MAG: DUF1203 domain-containing protein [Marinicella sp.]
MNTAFQIVAIDAAELTPYLTMDETDLREHHAKWVTADAKPGYPCRVSLQDAQIGEKVLLVPYSHHDVASPYRAAGPVFIRAQAKHVVLSANQVPDMLLHRTMSLRAYDILGMMQAAEIVSGDQLKPALNKLFQQPTIEYIHIHNAGAGCFNCKVVRAQE